MKAWVRYLAGIGLGLVSGGALAWQMAGMGLGRAEIINGPWVTSLGLATRETDDVTRASVARRGLLALPATETIYWQASVDSDGKALDGDCTYTMTGGALDARWWSVTHYDKAGYLVANDAKLWSFSGASIPAAEQAAWRVTISPQKPATGHWLPSAKGQPFDLTLRMYNPGKAMQEAPERAAMPRIVKGDCA